MDKPSEIDVYELVDQPDHYQSKGDLCISALDVIEEWQLNFSLGSAVKYILRAGSKPNTPVEVDLKKARWLIDREIERLERAKR